MGSDDQPVRLTVSVADGRGRPLRVAGLATWLPSAAPRSARGLVAIALIGDARMRTLNRTWRGADYATDVLSFPTVDDWPATTGASSPTQHQGQQGARRRAGGAPVWLGDIVIAMGVARRQAKAAGHSEATELRVLALHGLLHLLGYDHERDNGRMARLERQLRRRAGLREGLIERAHRS